jgi:hypothetical protein
LYNLPSLCYTVLVRLVAFISALTVPWCLILLILSPLFPVLSPLRITGLLLLALITLLITYPFLPDRPVTDEDFQDPV